MEDINTKTRIDTTCDNNLSESRFKLVLFFIRFAGIPVKIKPVSVLNAVYNLTVTLCFYITTIFLHVETFVLRHQLEDVMKKIRALFVIYVITWAHISLRCAA
jgi:hypothetical protein